MWYLLKKTLLLFIVTYRHMNNLWTICEFANLYVVKNIESSIFINMSKKTKMFLTLRTIKTTIFKNALYLYIIISFAKISWFSRVMISSLCLFTIVFWESRKILFCYHIWHWFTKVALRLQKRLILNHEKETFQTRWKQEREFLK